jgi:hypothetical protein
MEHNEKQSQIQDASKEQNSSEIYEPTRARQTASMIKSENQQNPMLNKAKIKEQLTHGSIWKKAVEIQKSVNTSQS